MVHSRQIISSVNHLIAMLAAAGMGIDIKVKEPRSRARTLRDEAALKAGRRRVAAEIGWMDVEDS
jgi:hypothetical protein